MLTIIVGTIYINKLTQRKMKKMIYIESSHPHGKNDWVSYIIKDCTDKIVHLGCCRFAVIAATPDKPDWIAEGPIYIVQIARDPDYKKIMNRAVKWCIDNDREDLRRNLQSNHKSNRHTVSVICNDTGETFKSINAVCDAHGLSYSALHKHLTRAIGHKSVKGKTYTRIEK